jgi:hypothetical protein
VQSEDQESQIRRLKVEIDRHRLTIAQLEEKLKRASKDLEERKSKDFGCGVRPCFSVQRQDENSFLNSERLSILRKRTSAGGPLDVPTLKTNIRNQLKSRLKRSNDDIQAIYTKLMTNSVRTTPTEMHFYSVMSAKPSSEEPMEAADVSRSRSLAKELDSFRKASMESQR